MPGLLGSQPLQGKGVGNTGNQQRCSIQERGKCEPRHRGVRLEGWAERTGGIIPGRGMALSKSLGVRMYVIHLIN